MERTQSGGHIENVTNVYTDQAEHIILRGFFGKLGLNWRILLKEISKKYCVSVRTGLNWLK
jgi:hypothetical protein